VAEDFAVDIQQWISSSTMLSQSLQCALKPGSHETFEASPSLWVPKRWSNQEDENYPEKGFKTIEIQTKIK
jgi:hypothetical protein